MGKPLMIQEDDDRRIERLKERLGIATKMEQDAMRRERLEQWKRAAARVAVDSAHTNAAFRVHSRLKRP